MTRPRIEPRYPSHWWTLYSLGAGHCWRSRDELICDVPLWTSSHGRAKAGWPARTYVQQLCADTGSSPEDLPEAMDDRVGWRNRVRDIHADSATWWWWSKTNKTCGTLQEKGRRICKRRSSLDVPVLVDK